MALNVQQLEHRRGSSPLPLPKGEHDDGPSTVPGDRRRSRQQSVRSSGLLRVPGAARKPLLRGDALLGHRDGSVPPTGNCAKQGDTSCSSDSDDSVLSSESSDTGLGSASSAAGAVAPYRVVLLGASGVGKSLLARLLCGMDEEQDTDVVSDDTYERTLMVSGEEATLQVLEGYQQNDGEDETLVQSEDVCIIVYSIAERASFERAVDMHAQVRSTDSGENLPVVLVGNKSDLVRSREVSLEEGRDRASALDCKFIETSAALQHNVRELLEGLVRQLRPRGAVGGQPGDPRGGKHRQRAPSRGSHMHRRRKQSLSRRAWKLLNKFVAKNPGRGMFRTRSRSCHDLTSF
uniref:RAS (RAD and GEM)-like GTP-binding 1 n=1 Tax=Eptatretus burgeri TaxID=7764 RepID=A0A8C4X1R9_EPTBU